MSMSVSVRVTERWLPCQRTQTAKRRLRCGRRSTRSARTRPTASRTRCVTSERAPAATLSVVEFIGSAKNLHSTTCAARVARHIPRLSVLRVLAGCKRSSLGRLSSLTRCRRALDEQTTALPAQVRSRSNRTNSKLTIFAQLLSCRTTASCWLNGHMVPRADSQCTRLYAGRTG